MEADLYAMQFSAMRCDEFLDQSFLINKQVFHQHHITSKQLSQLHTMPDKRPLNSATITDKG